MIYNLQENRRLEHFNRFKKDYENRKGQMYTENLFQKYWLRNILVKIKIVGTLSSCHDFKKRSEGYNELNSIFNHLRSRLYSKQERTKKYKTIEGGDLEKAINNIEIEKRK